MELSALATGCVKSCVACSHRGFTQIQSESQKQSWLRSKLSAWESSLLPLRGPAPARRLGYRSKACLRARWNEKGFWDFGLLARKRGQKKPELIPIPDCPVQNEFMNRVLKFFSTSLPPDLPLSFITLSGSLVTLVLKTAVLPTLPALDPSRVGVTGLFVNLNPAAGQRVYANRGWKLIWGQELGLAQSGLKHGPDSFQQLIDELYQDALHEAETYLSPSPGEKVLDLYSGAGASLAIWTRRGALPLGVELSGESVRCAALNAPAASLLRGKASERIPQMQIWLESGNASRTTAFLNPPRLGLETEVTHWLCSKARPEKIAYLSCSAGTLQRDLFLFTEAGYVVERIIPYDFFPQTSHVETLALLVSGALVPASVGTRSDSRLN